MRSRNASMAKRKPRSYSSCLIVLPSELMEKSLVGTLKANWGEVDVVKSCPPDQL